MSPLDPKTLESPPRLPESRLPARTAGVGRSTGLGRPCASSATGARWPKRDTRLLSSAFAAGLTGTRHGVGVGKHRQRRSSSAGGVSSWSKSGSADVGDFSSMITAEVTGDDPRVHRLGHALRQPYAAAVQMGDCRLESYLDGTLLFFLPSRYAGRDRASGQHLRQASREHRTDVSRPGDKPAGWRSDRHPLSRRRAARRKRLPKSSRCPR